MNISRNLVGQNQPLNHQNIAYSNTSLAQQQQQYSNNAFGFGGVN